MFSKYKFLIVNLVFPTSVFLEWEFFLIAPFPDHCLLVPFSFSSFGPELVCVAWPTGGQLVFFFCSRFSVILFGAQGSPSPGSLLYL